MSEQARKTQSTRHSESAAEPQETTGLQQKGKKIGDELDALLDEIDEVLEKNADEFVNSYVQHGGQ
jgi:ubiquitin-like protein Pup